MNAKPLPPLVPAADAQALLQDFPLQGLLEAFRVDRPDDGEHHDSAFLDSCLAHWIEGLEADMRRYPLEVDESHSRVQSRESASREALQRLRQSLVKATPNA